MKRPYKIIFVLWIISSFIYMFGSLFGLDTDDSLHLVLHAAFSAWGLFVYHFDLLSRSLLSNTLLFVFNLLFSILTIILLRKYDVDLRFVSIPLVLGMTFSMHILKKLIFENKIVSKKSDLDK